MSKTIVHCMRHMSHRSQISKAGRICLLGRYHISYNSCSYDGFCVFLFDHLDLFHAIDEGDLGKILLSFILLVIDAAMHFLTLLSISLSILPSHSLPAHPAELVRNDSEERLLNRLFIPSNPPPHRSPLDQRPHDQQVTSQVSNHPLRLHTKRQKFTLPKGADGLMAAAIYADGGIQNSGDRTWFTKSQAVDIPLGVGSPRKQENRAGKISFDTTKTAHEAVVVPEDLPTTPKKKVSQVPNIMDSVLDKFRSHVSSEHEKKGNEKRRNKTLFNSMLDKGGKIVHGVFEPLGKPKSRLNKEKATSEGTGWGKEEVEDKVRHGKKKFGPP